VVTTLLVPDPPAPTAGPEEADAAG